MRDGEAGVAKIETMSMRAAMQAFDLVSDAARADAGSEGRREEVKRLPSDMLTPA